ncbi:MAG: DUF4835 family protein [Bacteroidota bacterium]
MLKKLFSVLMISGLSMASWAQELNCKVTILRDKITGVDNQVFVDMQRALNEFMNNRKWTTEEFAATEKIDCNIMINLTGNKLNGDPEAFGATMNIQAVRPVFNSGYSTTTVNYVDKDVTFRFSQFNQLRFDDNAVSGTDPMASNLTAILAYYAYVILGFDYDSFSPSGGANYFKKAQNIVNNAPEGKGVNGWKSVENSRNRYWLVDQALNTRFQDVHNFWYTMHREGLDSMSAKPVEARTRILVNIKKLFQVNRENPNSALMQFVVNAKSDEFQRLVAAAPKQERGQYITLLTALDVPNAAKYNALK